MEIKTHLVIMTSILAVALISTAGLPSPFVNVLAQEGAITPEGINATMTGQNDTSTTSGNTAIPETIVTNATLAYAQGNDTMTSNATLAYAQGNDTMTSNATLAYAQGNDTSKPMNATLAYAQGNDTSKPMNATLAYAQGNDTMTSNATLPMSLIGNGTS